MPDGPGSDNGAALAGVRAGCTKAAQSLVHNGEWLGQRRLRKADFTRNLVRIACMRDEVGGVSTVLPHHADLASLATIDGIILRTRRAVAASLDAFHYDPIALIEGGHSLSEGNHRSRGLVARNDWILCHPRFVVSEPPLQNLEIGGANSLIRDAHQNFARFQGRNRALFDRGLMRAANG